MVVVAAEIEVTAAVAVVATSLDALAAAVGFEVVVDIPAVVALEIVGNIAEKLPADDGTAVVAAG